MTYEDQLRMIRDIAQREANARRGSAGGNRAPLPRPHPARARLDASGLRPRPLPPGMTVSAEFATGQRRLIEFFAAPIVSALHEAGIER